MIELHAFDDQRAQSDALAKAVGDALHASLAAQAAGATTGARPAMLAVSGGSSPRPFLQTLSTQSFDWARIAVTLVDDRWVPETDSASNSQLVRATLLQNAAKNAAFWPLVDTTQDINAHVAALNADARFSSVPDVAILGPAPAPMALLRGRYRYRLLLNARRSAELQNVIRTWLGALSFPPGVRVAVDVDPYSFV